MPCVKIGFIEKTGLAKTVLITDEKGLLLGHADLLAATLCLLYKVSICQGLDHVFHTALKFAYL